ncbi:uncharacterized protein [Amphiura filiformis]|uniref:uncharacterized protein n=1 Tax=Amphiura filiformis TaxID=82378 RepID=UPI003B20EF3A
MAGKVIGVAIGMEFVNGKMHIDTSWTTAVCLQERSKIISTASTLTTTPDVFDGVKQVLGDVLKGINPAEVKQINIATPQALNAVIEEDNLSRVTVVRLCGSASQLLLPFANIPDNAIKSKIMGDINLLNGGYEFASDKGANTPIARVIVEEVLQCIDDIAKSQIDNIVICGIYSPDKADQEIEVGELFTRYQPKINVTLSHQVVDHVGCYERENASILNASLKAWFNKFVKEIGKTLAAVNLHASFYLVQNDEKLISGENLGPALSQFPVQTFFPLEACMMKSTNFLTG